MNELIKVLKKELRKITSAELKALVSYKSIAITAIDLAGVEAVNKKLLQQNITETLENKGLSPDYIKKVRGTVVNFYEGAKKFPHKIEGIKIRIENINSINELIKLSRVFKREGTSVPSQKETKSVAKSHAKKKIKVVKGEENPLDKNKYFKIISSVIKINEDTFYKMDKSAIMALFDEVEKIVKILGGIKG